MYVSYGWKGVEMLNEEDEDDEKKKERSCSPVKYRLHMVWYDELHTKLGKVR